MMTRLLAAAALLLSACADQGGVQLAEPRPVVGGRPLKIATWNMEHLAEANGAGCRPRAEADYETLRRYAERLAADVVALQEVENEAAAEWVFPSSLYTIVMEARPESGRSGDCNGLPGASIRRQAVGFAIRKGVPFTRNPDYSALALGNPDLRWGVDVSVGEKRSLRLLAVHLKSGCNSGRAAIDLDCTVLFDQLPLLVRWVDRRASESTAFVVLGDWNRRVAAVGDPFWADLDDGEPQAADLTLAAADRRAACKQRYPEFIDHIATGAAATSRTVPTSFEEFTYGVPEAQHPSDHCPSSVVLHVW